MNSLTEAIGLSLPGNGTILATHTNRIELFKQAARQVVKNAFAYYENGDESVLPRNIATRKAFMNAMGRPQVPSWEGFQGNGQTFQSAIWNEYYSYD